LTVIEKSIALVGLMGVGKTSIGKRLAKRLGMKFVDIDDAIVKDIGQSITWIFGNLGEEEFRKIEKRVIAEEMAKSPQVIATGGGAFINDDTRALIKSDAISIWLDADIDILVGRVSKKKTRPLLEKGDKREILTDLMEQRNPYYEQADIRVESTNISHGKIVSKIISAIEKYE